MGEGEMELFQLMENGEISPKVASAFTKIIQGAVKEALSDCVVCPISSSDKADIGHLTGMIKDIGKGDVGIGIETIRDNHKIIKKWGRLEAQIGSVVLKVVVTFVIAGVLAATFFGLFGKKIPFKV